MFTGNYNLSDICNITNIISNNNDTTDLNNINLIKKPLVKNNKTYFIIKYNKKFLSNNYYDTIGLFRSIVCYNKQLCCFSPPKSLNYDMFKNKYKENEPN